MTRREKIIAGLAIMQAMETDTIKIPDCGRYIMAYIYLLGGNKGLSTRQLAAIIARDMTSIVHNISYLEECGYILSSHKKGHPQRRFTLTSSGYVAMRRFCEAAEKRVSMQELFIEQSEKYSAMRA